ncbi:MAG: retroviral-like aspartic protease family protein [Anaerolineales bacterium]|nr:retroviral-like aspartic protease family protein [Anaerolineales bacterium]
MTTAYDKSYVPPFPTLRVTLGEGSSRQGPFPALVDSGADVSLVPTRLLAKINAAEGRTVTIRSHFGERLLARMYAIPLSVESITLPGIFVVGSSDDEIILGRNVLNKLALFLDGPAQQTDLLDDATAQRLRARRE